MKNNKKQLFWLIPIIIILSTGIYFAVNQSSFGNIASVNYVKPAVYQQYVYQNFSVADNIYSIGFLPDISYEYHLDMAIEFWNYDTKQWEEIGADYMHRDQYGGTKFYRGDDNFVNELEYEGYDCMMLNNWFNDSDGVDHNVCLCRDDIVEGDINYAENPICVYEGTAKVESPLYSGNVIEVPYTDRQNYGFHGTVGYYPTFWEADSKYMRNADILSRLKYTPADSWSSYGGVFLHQFESETATIYYRYDSGDNYCYSQALQSAPTGIWESSMVSCEANVIYQDYYFVNGENVCEVISVAQGYNNESQYGLNLECESNRARQDLYLFEDNKCSLDNIFVGEETEFHFNTLEDCEELIVKKHSSIQSITFKTSTIAPEIEDGFVAKSLTPTKNFVQRSWDNIFSFFKNLFSF